MASLEERKKSKKSKKEKDKKRRRSSLAKDSTDANNDGKHKGLSSSKKSKRVKTDDEPEDDISSSTSPKKKIVIKSDPGNDEASQLRVQVAESSPTTDPIVISFPAGLPGSMTPSSSSTGAERSIRFDDEDEDEDENGNSNSNSSSKPPVFTWTRARTVSSKGKIIHGSDDTCTYISSNDGRGHDGRLTKFYVGVYHKPTSTLKLITSTEKGTVFSMDQSVTNYHDSKSLDFRNMSYRERRKLVFESFGSTRKKKTLKSQAANVVEMKSVVGAGKGMMHALEKQMNNNLMSESNKKVMTELKQKKNVMTAVERAYAEARRSFLPPFDESAKTAFRVYDSEEVAGEEAWSQLSGIVTACLHKGDEWKEAIQRKWPWPKATKDLLDLIMDTKKKGAKYQIKTIVLVNYLLKFHNRASKTFISGSQEELAKYLGLPREVSNRFLALFCTPTNSRGKAGYAVSKTLKDRRVVYTLIMYLLAHGKEMKVGSIQSLCEDLRIEVKDAINLYRQAGCICAKNKAGMVSVKLTVPLEFPPPRNSKKG